MYEFVLEADKMPILYVKRDLMTFNLLPRSVPLNRKDRHEKWMDRYVIRMILSASDHTQILYNCDFVDIVTIFKGNLG